MLWVDPENWRASQAGPASRRSEQAIPARVRPKVSGIQELPQLLKSGHSSGVE